ncbi:MAG: CHAD domain-containing protein [Magnetococcales bacterium]|nr:CHAD domain-containing protein [Magnetococcales bacterium]
MSYRTLRLMIGDGGQAFTMEEHPMVRMALVGKPRRLERAETFFDTPDLRLRQSGWTLTLRRRGERWFGCVASTRVERAGGGEWECGQGDAMPDWGEMRRHLPEGVREEIRGRKPEALFEMACVEERVRLEFPDGTRIQARELRGELRRDGVVVEPFHELILDALSGAPQRFFHAALALARHYAARLEPLSPADRGFVRLDAGWLAPVPRRGTEVGRGAGVLEAFSLAGSGLLQEILDNLAPLAHGSGATRLGAAVQARGAVARLAGLFGLFHPLLPDKVRREPESELNWLLGELEPLGEWLALERQVLQPLRRRCGEYVQLEQVSEKYARKRQLAAERVAGVVTSVRFTQLMLGFAGWLVGVEELRNSLLATEPLLRERLQGSGEGLAREGLRRLHKLMGEQGGRYWEAEGPFREPVEPLAWAEAIAYALELFPAWFEEKKARPYREALAGVVGSLRALVGLADARRLWDDLDPGRDEALRALFAGWHGALLEREWEEGKRAWGLFSAAAAPFG